MTQRKRSLRPSKRRAWTEEEDRLMLCQAMGHFSMHKLEKMVGGSRESIFLRMTALGVAPIIKPRKSDGVAERVRHGLPKIDDPLPGDAISGVPHVGHDRLLRALHEQHGDRRYEALDLRIKRKETA